MAVENPPAGMQRIIPSLFYQDAPAAITFLCAAFGFSERHRVTMKNGSIGHCELVYQDNVVMLASVWDELGAVSQTQQRGISQQIYFYVDQIDEHFARAKKAGATIIAPPENMFYGDRVYRAKDLEGHSWVFGEHIEDIPFDAMQIPDM